MKYKKLYSSPIGDLVLTSDGEFLTGLYFLKALKSKIDYLEEDLEVFKDTISWLNIYFCGKVPGFTPKIKLENLTPFREDVLKILLDIPYGTTVSYGDIAKTIAKKRGIKKMSSQAIGGAVGWNPICIIIPCHRVIGSNNRLTGYSGGIENKIALLKLENVDLKSLREGKVKI